MSRRLPALALALALAAPSAAKAEGPSAWLGAQAELLLARSVDPTTSALFPLGVGGALAAELRPASLVGVVLGAGAFGFAGDGTSGAWVAEGRAGLRLHLGDAIGWAHDPWLEAGGVLAGSGQVVRGGIFAGVGLGFEVAPAWRVGPVARVRWSSDPAGGDPMWVELGVQVALFGEGPARPDADGDGVWDGDDPCPSAIGPRTGPHAGCPSRDADEDGVLDADDRCPEHAAGPTPDPARPGCPIHDADGDGVPDAEDRCPTLPQSVRADPNHPGCPIADRDGDSVPDAEDRCPDEPGAPSSDPTRNGCRSLVVVSDREIRILRPVFFATGRDTILEESFPVLYAVADAVRAGGFARVRVEGHTDDQGSHDSNLDLSQRRAESVRQWLVAHEVPEAALEAVGFGETVPIESNATELGRAANRRVEFHIVDGRPEG